MKKWVLIAGSLLVVSAALVAGRADAEDESTPSIKEVMDRLHKGANSPLNKLKAELKSDEPAWDEIAKQTKDFVILGAALSKNEPKKGSKASWNTLAEGYFVNAKALDDSAKSHDKAATQTALQRLSASCKVCHAVHKGQ